MSSPVVSDHVLFYINGHRRRLAAAAVVDTTLLSYIRTVERLTGAKLGCGEGGCGACTVLLTRYDAPSRRLQHLPVNACLFPLAAADGAAITTVEAVGDRTGRLAPLQEALASANGSQCGFCTPGIVMSVYAMLRQRAADDLAVAEEHIEHAVDGNLCRCTGYRPILAGLRSLAMESNGDADAMCRVRCRIPESAEGVGCAPSGPDACCGGSNCAPSASFSSRTMGTQPAGNEFSSESLGFHDSPSSSPCVQPGLDRDLLFPPELVSYAAPELNLENRWLRPVTLRRLLCLRKLHPEAVLVVGSTELSVELYSKPNIAPRVYICISQIPDLSSVVDDECRGLVVGAAATWASVSAAIVRAEEKRAGTPLAYQTSSLAAVREQLRWFAGTQVRSVASVGGNVVTASPISDLNPIWIAAGAVFEISDAEDGDGERRHVAAADFFIGYRKVDLKHTEVLVAIIIPWNQDEFDITQSFKTSRRREDDIAIVSAGIRLHLRPPDAVSMSHGTSPSMSNATWKICTAQIGLGGMASKTIAATEIENGLQGAAFSKETLFRAIGKAGSTLSLPPDVPGGMPEFRLALTQGFIFKAFVNIGHFVRQRVERLGPTISNFASPPILGFEAREVRSVLKSFESRPSCRASQIYERYVGEDSADCHDYIGKPVVHASAKLQVSGDAKYVDDMPPASPGELQGVFVMSSVPHGRVVSVDVATAVVLPGVVDIVLARDVPGSNTFGVTPVADEKCFADGYVTCVGQVIGLVLADTKEHAEAAAASVRVIYEELPATVTIEEALDALGSAGDGNPFAKEVARHSIVVGCVDGPLECGPVVEGHVRIGAQEHFYLEPHGTIAVPEENAEMVVYASTQAATKTQEVVARVLGVPMHKIVCRVKRLGGGFGGKESRSMFVSAAAAVAAKKHGVPVRVILSRKQDMLASGTRHAFLARYRCSFDPRGRISALDIKLFQNMGNSVDLSVPVLDRALHHCQNCYDIPNVRFVGVSLRTNSPSATAFRGFGGPQGMLVAETVLEHVAEATKIDSNVVRDLNLYGKHGNKCMTLVGMPFNPEPLVQCWDGVLKDACYADILLKTEEFNRKHRFVKRGVAAVPTMFGISFTFKTYNQAGALVHIYHADGSVLISHGGVEMGQGLHTKLCQVAASELGLPLDMIFISETSTDKVANTSPSAASASTDMYGMAVLDACRQLSDRLAPIRKFLGDRAPWGAVVHQAWMNRVDLSAHGFYATPTLDNVDLSTPGAKGRPFFYYTNGAAVSLVEVDMLTGQHEVLSTNIVMDVGRSLNPALDIGQIEGGFVQGLGWCTMEEVVRASENTHKWLRKGDMLTLGPGTYKIPAFSDIPHEFRVRVLSGIRNERDTIHSSKAIGEPPLFLASSVFFAIRQAIRAARMEFGIEGWFELDSPATVERIRHACPDVFQKDSGSILEKGTESDSSCQTGWINRPGLSL